MIYLVAVTFGIVLGWYVGVLSYQRSLTRYVTYDGGTPREINGIQCRVVSQELFLRKQDEMARVTAELQDLRRAAGAPRT